MKYATRCCLLLLIFCGPLARGQQADTLKLKNYRPVSIYKTPQTTVTKAKYGVTDFHSHDYVNNDPAALDAWVAVMNKAGITKTIILSCKTGTGFDSVVAKYARYKDRFEIWCGFDYTGYDQPGWQANAIKELERCYAKGARGVGELGDKGLGEFYAEPVAGWGMHIDDERLRPLLQKCAALKMPVNVHVAEDEWNYLPADAKNDGLMNAFTWRVDMAVKGIINHDQLILSLENAVRNNKGTTFIASHLGNCCANLKRLGELFDRYPNFYADISARYAEVAPIPGYAGDFFEKYADRLVFGTDMGTDEGMYQIIFKILETGDEHFYAFDYFEQHWPLYGLSLSANCLKKIYQTNAKKILK
jgi:uncharacterized protein